MYRITYDGLTIFDPYGNANEVVSDASMSVEVNASAYLDFTMAITHPLYDTIRERAGVVTLTWGSTVLFEGIIESIEMDIQGNKSISCVSAMDYLNDTHVRPYSTVAGEADLTAPSSVDGYFQWLIDQHNDHVLDASKMFDVGINQGANLQQNNFIYRSSESEPTTASEITDQILDSLGGYLTMRYEDGRKVLDLYADLHTMNAQIVDFGVNITDFTKTTDTTDQYTAILLHGGSPTFEGGDLEGGDWSHWETHPNTPLVGDKTHGGSVASYFVSGTGEYINDSFFYSRPGRRYKASVYVKNERGSNVTIRGSYQYEQAGDWTTVNVNSSLAVENKGDQWTEFSFDFQPNLSEYTKIRPRWYFDNVGNDNNRRVYLDDFSFSQIDGDTEVSEDPIGLEQVPDGVSSFDADVFKSGDVLYSTSAVERYGYKEEVFEDTTITNIDDLVQAGIKELNKSKDPQITLDIKAVDLALFMEGYTHLNVGDAVRVRSTIHDTDEFLMVNSITLDLQDPGQSEYVIGKAYDSLTGQQSGFLRSLNSGINSSLDAVASLDQTTKDQAIQIGSVEQVANQAKNTANNAQNTANNAQNTANANKEAINSIKDAQTEYEKQLEQMQQGVADATEEIGQVNERIEGMNSEIESAKSDIDSLRSSTETELQNVKQSVSKVQSDVESVSQKAEDLASDLDGTKATVEQVTTDLGEVKTTVSNAATKADQALQVSTSASQTATEAKTTATSAYQDAQSALTQSSTASQTANAVKTELETKYSTTDEIAEQYATKSLVEQTSQSITSTVEATYATKATVEALENIANNAVQTWMGSGVPTLSNKPASDWNTAELKSQHSGDIYYDSDTGYSYRFGSSDGSSYSWSLIKDTDISKAVADAAKAQQTAEGVSDEVTQLKTDIPATYATKTEVKQTTDSIKSTVSEVASTANSALSKATTVEQTANGLQTTVTEQAEKLDGAVTTISQVSQRVDSLSSTITQVSNTEQNGLIRNGGFETGDMTGWTTAYSGTQTFVEKRNNAGEIGDYLCRFYRPSNNDDNTWTGIASEYFPIIAGHTYQITVSAFYSDAARETAVGLRLESGGYLQRAITTNLGGDSTWRQLSGTIKMTSGNSARLEIDANGTTSETSRILVDGVSVIDVTEGKTANDTANSALSQSSTVKQELTSFKTSVQQTYETKNDALSKQSSLQQSVNNLRTEVSETYTTKDEFNALEIGGTNLIQNSTFDSGTKSPWTDYLNGGSATIVDGYDGHKGVTIARSNYTGTLRCGVALYDGFLIKSIQSGDKFTLSAWIRINEELSGTNTDNTIYVRIKQPNSSATYDAALEIPKNGNIGQWQRISRTFEITNVDENNPVTQMGILIGGNGSVTISCVKLEKGTKPTAWSPAPEDMLSNADAARTYSTKSYVDQTARTVSLGVVEEYKNGQHGSALATQSDITAAKDSITSTVSQTYATKNDVGVGNLIKNGDFSDGSSNWVTNGGTSKIVDGTYGKQFVFTQTGPNTNGNNRTYNPSYNHINGQAYEVSFYAKADKSSKWHFGPNTSSKAASVTLDTTLKQYTMQYQADGTTVLSVWTDNPTATIYLERVKLSIASGYYATKTEVKQTSDSLTVTISSAMSKAESAATAASNAQNTANAAAGSSTNYIKNGGPNGTSNPIAGWTVSGNVYKHTFPGGQNHVDLGYTTLAHPIVAGRKYRLSLDARVTSGTFSSSDYFVFGLSNGWQSIRAQALTSSWKTYSGVVTSTREATQVFMSSYVGSSGSKVVEMRNVSMTDVTETYSVAINAQNTANIANTNATNANNRVGDLETCIKMTSDGVRVGKIENGNFTGYSALVNSAGSFDILGSDSSVISRFSSKGLQIGSGGDKYHFFVGTGNSSEEAFIGILNDENNDFNAPPDPEAGYSGLFFDRSPQYHAASLVDTNGPIAITGQGITISSNSPSSPLFLQEAGGGITTHSDTKIYCQDRTSGTKVNVGANMRVQMKNLSGQAPHYEMTIDKILSNDLGYKLVANGDVKSIEIEVAGIYQVFGTINVYCPNNNTRIGIGILNSPYTAWSSTRDDLVIENGNTWYNRFFMASCPLAKGNRITWRGSSHVSSGAYTTLCLMYMGPAFR